MLSENDFERLLQKMRSGMVLFRIQSSLSVYAQSDLVTDAEHSLCHYTHMDSLSIQNGDRIFNFELTFRCNNNTPVADLAALCRIERRLLRDDRTLFAFRERLHKITGVLLGHFRHEERNFRFVAERIISREFRLKSRIDLIIDSKLLAHVICGLSGIARTLSLFLHARCECFLIDFISLFCQDILREVERESVRIVKLKCFLSGECLFIFRCELILKLGEDLESLVDRLSESFLFLVENFVDKYALLLELRIAFTGCLDNGRRKIREERSADAEKASVSCRTADQPAENIAPAFIRRHDPV